MYYFTDDCMTGISIVDNEHRQLFETINRISVVIGDANRPAEETMQSARKLMEDLKDYAATHFAHEENYMREIHDPELLRQIKEHSEFTAKVNSVGLENINASKGAKILYDMMEYLSLWLYRHILSSDTLIGKMKIVHNNPVLLKFTKEYYTGIDVIDKEHSRLFDILSDLNALNQKDYVYDKYDAIIDIVEELKDYTVKHFQDEERYMKSINYEGLLVQQSVHQSFVKKIEEISFEELDKNQQEYINVLVDFLANWLINHIMKMDQKIPVRD